MRLVVDLQCAHGSSRNRGIGRYSLSLLRGLSRQRADHEIIIVLNGLFPESVERLRGELADIVPADAIRVLHLPEPISSADANNDARREAAELIREQFLSSLNPDFVLICSLFEGLDDNIATSIGAFNTRIPTATILYDLIPLINRSIYLANPIICRWYERKLAHLRRSDLLLAISGSTRQEAIHWLNSAPESVINILGAADDQFYPSQVSQHDEAAFRLKYGLIRPFVMYTGGIDYRKNIDGLIKAFAHLPWDVRQAHQLAIVCAMTPSERAHILSIAHEHGLREDELVTTGYISEEDLVTCYRTCKLFVFPSWHEGFGLPVLEAMKCGRAALASNCSSLPEVVGMAEALFDPLDTNSIRDAMARGLTDESFRTKLEHHGLEQARKFEWDRTAQLAWNALLAAHEVRSRNVFPTARPSRRPRLAYLSPLPPAMSGISDYSAELIPELARRYDIDVVVAQDSVSVEGITANYAIRGITWFRNNFNIYDRILYHFGNSEFHSHMFELLRDCPGVVVLHDFYLSGIVAHRDLGGDTPGKWARDLLESEGWPAITYRFTVKDPINAVYRYPCNLRIIQDALGVIVHAEFSRLLARQFYGPDAGQDWHKIPLQRQLTLGVDRAAARRALGFSEHDIVVCSFGMLGPTKMNDRLLAAWLGSPLARDPNCHLVFVGENNPGGYGLAMADEIAAGTFEGSVRITGRVDSDTFRQWLAAADIGVQLRMLSRGETSAAVLDCMNAGLPTVVNAHGSMAELPRDCAWILPDDFTNSELIETLSTLRRDSVRRTELGTKARAHIARDHNPRLCAEAYADAIESSYARADRGPKGLEARLIEQGRPLATSDWPQLIGAMARNTPPPYRKKRLLIDVSELVRHDFGSGIQRVVRSILLQWVKEPLQGFIVEPVYATLGRGGYRYARNFTCRLLNIESSWCEDEVVEPVIGDIFLGLDLQPSIVAQQLDTYHAWRRAGVIIRFVIYDLLPVVAPKFFMEGGQSVYRAWLEHISQFDGLICISRAVADEYCEWLDCYGPNRISPLEVDWFHLGGDREVARTTQPLPDSAEALIETLRQSPTFLSVGTIEPRKGYRQTLLAMEMVWAKGIAANFVIIGKRGWLMDDFIESLRSHREFGKRLHWLEGVSDTYLYAIYEASRCLIAASEGEGFGLPLIEAAHHDIPILARDLPVFREVAGEAADYFPDTNAPEAIASAVEMMLFKAKRPPLARGMCVLTWAESAASLLSLLRRETPPYRRWMPVRGLRFWGSDPRLTTELGVSDGRSVHTNETEGFLISGPDLPLGAGKWVIVAEGEATKLDGNETISVTSGQGLQEHVQARLSKQDRKWRIEAAFELDRPVSHIEVKVRVSKESVLSVRNIELRPDETNNQLIDVA